MDTDRIEWKRSATKELRSLPTHMVQRIVEAVTRLSATPFPPGVRKLSGAQHTSGGLRVGQRRVVGDGARRAEKLPGKRRRESL